MPSEYAKSLGARLRSIRQQQGLSLQGVEEKSNGRWKAVVVGSYERGDRAVTVSRLAELADFYRVPVSELLPDGSGVRHEPTSKIVLDLEKLYDQASEDARRTSPATPGPSSSSAATTTAGCSPSAPTTCARWRSSTTSRRPA